MNHSKWKIIHASVIGTSHIEKGTECQDRYAFKVIPIEDVLVAVLSDGAGSSDRSQVGAELACSLFIEEVEKQVNENGDLENLNKDFGLIWIDYFRQKISELAEEEGKEIRDFACTFLAAVIWGDKAVFYQVGDGGIVCSPTGESESYYFGIMPAAKVYANATDFITQKNAGECLRFESTEEAIEDLVMFTDGIEPVAVNFQNKTPHEPFLMPMLAPIRKAETVGENLNEKLKVFLNSQRVNEKTDDDKTLFMASRFKPTVEKRPELDFAKQSELMNDVSENIDNYTEANKTEDVFKVKEQIEEIADLEKPNPADNNDNQELGSFELGNKTN